MLNITNHKKNANQNHTLTGWSLSKEWKISVGKNVEKIEPLSKMVQPLGRNSMKIPQKIQFPYESSIPLSGIYPKELKSVSERDIFILAYCSIIHSNQDKEAT